MRHFIAEAIYGLALLAWFMFCAFVGLGTGLFFLWLIDVILAIFGG